MTLSTLLIFKDTHKGSQDLSEQTEKGGRNQNRPEWT